MLTRKSILIYASFIILTFNLFTCDVKDKNINAAYQEEIKQNKKYLEKELEYDGIALLQDYPGKEKYRLIWSNGWISTIYFTITQQENHYSLILEGYSTVLKKYQKQIIELEAYEWGEIQKQLNKIDFWHHPPSIKEEMMQSVIDGTWYLLEGIKDDHYHHLHWPYADNKEKLVSLFIKFARLENFNTVIYKKIERDSAFYEISLDYRINTLDLNLITDHHDTIRSQYLLIQMGLPIKDTLKLYDFQLIQTTRDSLTNIIPLGKPNFYSTRAEKRGTY